MKHHLTPVVLMSLALMGTAAGASASVLSAGLDLRPLGVSVAGEARLELAQDRRSRGGDEDGGDRYRNLDRAIKIVLRRTGGTYVSAEPISDDVYRVVVRMGNRIVAFRVNVRNESVSEE